MSMSNTSTAYELTLLNKQTHTLQVDNQRKPFPAQFWGVLFKIQWKDYMVLWFVTSSTTSGHIKPFQTHWMNSKMHGSQAKTKAVLLRY